MHSGAQIKQLFLEVEFDCGLPKVPVEPTWVGHGFILEDMLAKRQQEAERRKLKRKALLHSEEPATAKRSKATQPASDTLSTFVNMTVYNLSQATEKMRLRDFITAIEARAIFG